MMFPCSERSQTDNEVNFVITFNTTTLVNGPTIDSLLNLVVRFIGNKTCNCTGSDCSSSATTDGGGSGNDALFQNSIFYGVIGCVGGLIVLVILVTLFYHCFMVGSWRKTRTPEEIK